MDDTLFATSFAAPVASTLAPQALCSGTVPLVLLPVRLETRWFPMPNGTHELRVRVYPDKIHVDTHHPELTTNERTWGTQYWQQDWVAADDAARANAWSTLAGRFGAERAAWIARVLQPTNFEQRPTSPPVFPTLPPVGERGEDAWRTAPKARLLPDRWIAMLHVNGSLAFSVTGNPITQPLPMGPDPGAPPLTKDQDAVIKAGDALALDDGMMWMVDFDRAEAVGMGLRLTIPQSLIDAGGIDKLVVFGVAASLSPADTATQLADLLDAHHYTDGLQFLRFGTPTNNTDDQRSGYTTEDPGHARSFANEVLAQPLAAPNAARVGLALGLPSGRIASTLGRLPGAADDHDMDQRSMNTVLWQVGWGYYLTNLMGAETGLTTTSVEWAHDHFVNFVRSGGPFAAICAGRQPYGILPVTSIDLWAPGAGEPVTTQDGWLKELLRTMREKLWRPVLPNVARIGLRAGVQEDPDSDLASVMTTDAVSHGYITRPVFGRHYLEHLYMLSGASFGSLGLTQDAVAGGLLSALGLPTLPAQRPHAAHAFHWDLINWVTAPLVQAGEISPWRKLEADDPTAPNYIARLLSLTIQQIIDSRPAPTATDGKTSLLEMLLRHAMLREIATAAARLASANGKGDVAALLRDLELIDLVDVAPVNHVIQSPPQTLHWRRQLDGPYSNNPADGTIRQYLEKTSGLSRSEVKSYVDFRASLDHLRNEDSESLQFLTQGTLDLSSHRLDAWITSYATKRLWWMTNDGPIGQHVGAYGWVENLMPADPLVPLQASDLPPGEQAPLYALPKDSGFIHAPSVTHASAAALLRNAHLGPSGLPTEKSPFAIDLSSRRVREASRLLDGVRQGQPLTALLGYRIERRLHDLRLDRYVTALRKVAPLNVREREANGASAEVLAANNVVDALALVKIVQEKPTDVDDALAKVPQSLQPERDKVKAEITALTDSVDGLTDALTAEVAYQMARGNTMRLASTLAAIAQGDAVPPELEVARTPRGGNSLTHRTIVLFSGTSNAGAGWTNTSMRTVSERWLNAWIRAQLGDARKVRCTVEQLDGNGVVTQTVKFVLNDVPMSPLDFVYNVQPAGQSAEGNATPTVAEQLVLYHARTMTGGFGASATIRLQHARPTDLASGETTLFDVLAQARAIRRLLETARGLRPEDVCPPDGVSDATIDLVELQNRVVHYESALFNANRTLATLVASSTATAAALRTAMLSLGDFAIGPFVPNIAVGDTPDVVAALIQQSKALLKISKERLDQSTALKAQVVAADQSARRDQLVARARAIYGKEFVVLPNFTLATSASAELNSALGASTTVQGGDPLAVHGWFARSARVRDSLARLAACMRGAEVLASGARLNLSVAQLPFVATQRWVGLTPLPGADIPPSKLSLVVQPLTAIDATKPLCGLFVDEWVEVVPNQTETTALAFQFDPPNSFAPQNVLIAVPPVPGQDWTTETLRRVLVETLDLAKLRAVDPSLLGPAAQYLPALYIPFNAADDAVSTDFAPLTVTT